MVVFKILDICYLREKILKSQTLDIESWVLTNPSHSMLQTLLLFSYSCGFQFFVFRSSLVMRLSNWFSRGDVAHNALFSPGRGMDRDYIVYRTKQPWIFQSFGATTRCRNECCHVTDEEGYSGSLTIYNFHQCKWMLDETPVRSVSPEIC